MSYVCVQQEERVERLRLTHHVSNEVLQRSSFNELCDQIQPFVFVEHTNELQYVWMLEASHYLDLKFRHVLGHKKQVPDHFKQGIPNQLRVEGS